MKNYYSWNEAKKDLGMLKFDLGQSSESIEEQFNDGFILVYNHRLHCYIWQGNGDLDMTQL